jgi:hypothetical protein
MRYDEAVIRKPDELVKFTLIFDGDLPSAGNKSQPGPASVIRNVFHDQLADLWDTNVIFRQLARMARTWPRGYSAGSSEFPSPELPDYTFEKPELHPGQVDYCAPIPVPAAGASFIPIVRNSLYLNCAVDILFLRHEEPISLMRHGGDLDGRLKTLFDALKMPNPKDPVYKGNPPTDDPLYVVLEDDSLISDFSVTSGRLLGRAAKKKREVRLTVDITIKVLRVFEHNQILIGG